MKFSSSTNGFYDVAIHGDAIPADAVEITDAVYNSMLDGQAMGKVISADSKGKPVLKDQPPPARDQIVAAIAAGVQAHMDATAKSMGYDDMNSAVTYADEPAVTKFQAEGRALRAWRSLVWARCYQLLAEVEAATREAMTAAQVIALLPAVVTPE